MQPSEYYMQIGKHYVGKVQAKKKRRSIKCESNCSQKGLKKASRCDKCKALQLLQGVHRYHRDELDRVMKEFNNEHSVIWKEKNESGDNDLPDV